MTRRQEGKGHQTREQAVAALARMSRWEHREYWVTEHRGVWYVASDVKGWATR